VLRQGSNERDSSSPPARSSPNECCRPNRGRCVPPPVGTRGAVGWMRGPGACPRGDETGWPHATQTTRHASRTRGRCVPGSCRDKGQGGVDEGAWCLSSWGCDHLASRNPNESKSDQGQAPGPHPSPRPPLVPTGRRQTFPLIPPFGHQHSSGCLFKRSRTFLRIEPCLNQRRERTATWPLKNVCR